MKDRAALPPAERNRLVGILGRLGSDHDGERAAAGLLASRLLTAKGLVWDDLVLTGNVRQPNRPDAKPSRPEAPGTRPNPMVQCYRHLACLSEWERRFVLSLDNSRKSPTPKQTAKLVQIADALTARGLL